MFQVNTSTVICSHDGGGGGGVNKPVLRKIVKVAFAPSLTLKPLKPGPN